MRLFDLSGRVAVVTGGNGGIGLGMARGLAKAGADIAVAARNTPKSAAAEAELREMGADILAVFPYDDPFLNKQAHDFTAAAATDYPFSHFSLAKTTEVST